MSPDRALSQSQVAKLLHVSTRTVKRWTESGLIPVWFVNDNGRPVYSERTIAAHQRRAGELAAERAAS